MGAAYFYHLTHSTVEETLPLLTGKAMGAGWRVAIRATAAQRLEWFDQVLWRGGAEDFLPHGIAGGDHDALQPVLLTTQPELSNQAHCLITVDSAEVGADEVQSLDRVCVVFDGSNPDQLNHARFQWKSLTDAGCSAQYWSEESGSWQKKAEK